MMFRSSFYTIITIVFQDSCAHAMTINITPITPKGAVIFTGNVAILIPNARSCGEGADDDAATL